MLEIYIPRKLQHTPPNKIVNNVIRITVVGLFINFTMAQEIIAYVNVSIPKAIYIINIARTKDFTINQIIKLFFIKNSHYLLLIKIFEFRSIRFMSSADISAEFSEVNGTTEPNPDFENFYLYEYLYCLNIQTNF